MSKSQRSDIRNRPENGHTLAAAHIAPYGEHWPQIDPSDYVHGWHIDLICEHLEAVNRGEIRKLLINIPPRGAKDTK